MGAAAHLATNHPGLLQRLDVLGSGRERDRERFRQLAYRPLAVGKFAQHPPARGIAERVKDDVERSGL